MMIKKLFSAIIATIVSTSVLSSYATAWTKPEYSFDYDALVAEYYDSCYNYYCNNSLYIENAYEPGRILIFLKCEYSYFNSEWTIKDFPEIESTGVKIDRIVNHDRTYADKTDEEIQDYLKRDEYARHTRISIYLDEDYISETNEAKVGSAIIDECRRGKHPEISSIIFDTDLYKPKPVQVCDLNNDSKINAVDATMIARCAVGIYELDSEQRKTADVNKDGSINAIDSTMVSRFAVGVLDVNAIGIVPAEVKSWRQGYGLSDILLQTETTEFPCMTIVHSMAELEALNGSLYQIDFDNIYSFKCELTEDYLSEEFFYENDFVIILSYETSGNNEYDVQSAKITQDHIFEVTLSHYTPATFTCDMSMQVTGIAVPKGNLDHVSGYSINWKYYGHDSNVPKGNIAYESYLGSIPEKLYIECE